MTLLMRDQENLEKGEVKQRKKIVMKMLLQGFKAEQIKEICDTTEEEIEECRRNISK